MEYVYSAVPVVRCVFCQECLGVGEWLCIFDSLSHHMSLWLDQQSKVMYNVPIGNKTMQYIKNILKFAAIRVYNPKTVFSPSIRRSLWQVNIHAKWVNVFSALMWQEDGDLQLWIDHDSRCCVYVISWIKSKTVPTVKIIFFQILGNSKVFVAQVCTDIHVRLTPLMGGKL